MGLGELDDGELPPAARLEGMTLPSGWTVLSRIKRLDGQTGSAFSIGYLARNDETAQTAFLKALDFSEALQEENLLEALGKAIDAYKFEQTLLELCADRRMNRVVRALGSGYMKVDDSQLGRVPYLLFEPADGDIRKALTTFGDVELAWALKLLHEVAHGLEQLHYAQVAHQDLKPSNVLTFAATGEFKVSDLGCASRKGIRSPRDDKRVPGGWSIAPPELRYDERHSDWIVSRVAADLYSLGSLAVFLFAGASMNAIVSSHLPENMQPMFWRGTYREVLPFVVEAHSKALRQMEASFSGEIPLAIFEIVKQLCEPDPLRRGDPKSIGRPHDQYDVRKYVSRLGRLARRAQYAQKQVLPR